MRLYLEDRSQAHHRSSTTYKRSTTYKSPRSTTSSIPLSQTTTHTHTHTRIPLRQTSTLPPIPLTYTSL